MTTLNDFTANTFPKVDIGVIPNDGTGDNIREAFNLVNRDFAIIVDFLTNMEGPVLPNLTVDGTTVTNVIEANIGRFYTGVTISSDTDSTSTDTGALVVVGGVGIGGNVNIGGNLTVEGSEHILHDLEVDGNVAVHQDLHVDGTVYGDVEAMTLTANTLGVLGDSICGGNLIVNGTLTVFGNVATVTTSEYLIQHPTIELGATGSIDIDGNVHTGNVIVTENDGKDRGIAFHWFDPDLSSQQVGFYGFNNATQTFTFIPNSHYPDAVGYDNDVYLGDPGDAVFNTVFANIVSNGTSTFNAVTANTLTVTNGITGTLMTNNQPNINTVGNLTNLQVNGLTTLLDGLVVTGDVSVTDGNINVTGGQMFINGDMVATVNNGGGGTIEADTVFTSGTRSVDPVTGAVIIYGQGGMGIGGNLNVGGETHIQTLTATDITANTFTGTLLTNVQPNINTIGTLGNLNVSGMTTTNNLTVNSAITTSTLSATLGIYGPITYATQTNITSLGTLTSLTVQGNITTLAGTINGPLVGNVTGNLTGNVLTPIQTNITQVGTLSSLSVSGTAGVGSLTSVGNISTISGNIRSTTGNIETGGNISGTYLYGTLRTAAQPYVTSLGTLSSLSVLGTSTLTGNVTLGSGLYTTGAGTKDIGTSTNRFGTIYATNLNTSGTISSTGNISTSNSFVINSGGYGIVFPDGTVQTTAGAANGTGSVFYANIAGNITNQTNSATITAMSANIANTIVLRDGAGSFSAGTITAAGFIGPLTGYVTGNVSGSSATVRNAAQPTITSVGTLTGLTVSGNSSLSHTTITGNLTVNGTTTTLNTAALNVADLNITVAANATTAALANGAGLTVAGANATFTYTSADDRWNLNKSLTVPTIYGAVSGNASTASQWQTTRYLTLTGDVTGNVAVDGSGNMAMAATVGNDTHTHTSAYITDATNAATANMIIKRGSAGEFSANAATLTSASISGLTSTGTLSTTGAVTIGGNLTVNGTTTTVNATTLEVADLNVVVAKNASTAAAANGAGLTVAGANATFTYTSADDRWNLNKSLNVPTIYGAVVGNASTATNATNIVVTDDTATNATFYPVFSDGFSGSARALKASSARLQYNPSTGRLSVPLGVNGPLYGNASTASQWQTTRYLTLTGDATGNVAVDGSGNSAMTVTVTDNSHNHTSANISDATPSVSANMIVKRDAFGNFSGNVITATTFVGNLTGNITGVITGTVTGNADTASRWLTTRYLTLTGDTTGNVAVDGSGNMAMTTVVTDNSHNHTSANISDATNAATANMIVKRDGSGNFNSNTIIGTTLTSTGNVTIPTTGKGIVFSDGSVQYTASQVSVNYNIDTNASFQMLWGDGNNLKGTAGITCNPSTDTITASLFNGLASSAKYADLAEKYQSDGQYESGTVVVFGGNREVTVTGHRADVSVAGVVSTAPAYLMNVDAPNSVAVALRGKVPVKCMGPVRKGDLLITSYLQGYAESVGKDKSFGLAVFAKSLVEDLAEGPKTINAVII